MYSAVKDQLASELDEIRAAGLYKAERVIGTPQSANVKVGGEEVLNLCANNYLGLADHPALIEAAQQALDRWGFGMASVRFICGTQEIHKELEARLSAFLQTEDTILYGSCFDANGGLFETLLGPRTRSSPTRSTTPRSSTASGSARPSATATRNSDMDQLEQLLKETQGARRRLIATDGVFSMDGYLAKLDEICDLADRYDAMVMVDDSHAVGFVGEHGRGTPELKGVMDRVDIITGTLGKALGGASGGYTSGRREIVELLRQRSRPYLFSNTLAPPIAATSLKVLELLEGGGDGPLGVGEHTGLGVLGRSPGLQLGEIPRGGRLRAEPGYLAVRWTEDLPPSPVGLRPIRYGPVDDGGQAEGEHHDHPDGPRLHALQPVTPRVRVAYDRHPLKL